MNPTEKGVIYLLILSQYIRNFSKYIGNET